MTALNINLLTSPFTPSTSGSYTFSCTQYQVIRQAMLDIGALEPYEQPTAQEYADCSFRLNMMVKTWMGNTDFAPGLKMWTRKRADLFLGYSKFAYNLGLNGDNWVDSTAGLAYPQSFGQSTLTANAASGASSIVCAAVTQMNIGDYIGVVVGSDIFWTTVSSLNSVTLTAGLALPLSGAASSGAYVWNYTTKARRPLAMISCVLRDIYANDTPLNFMTTERYESLPTKTASTNIADPTAILYESQFSNQTPNGILYLDVGGAQDVTKHLHCVYLSPVQDLVNPGDAVDYPQSWFDALCWGHGKKIAPMFDCEWTQIMEANYQEALTVARQGDPATTDVYFEPNAESPYSP